MVVVAAISTAIVLVALLYHPYNFLLSTWTIPISACILTVEQSSIVLKLVALFLLLVSTTTKPVFTRHPVYELTLKALLGTLFLLQIFPSFISLTFFFMINGSIVLVACTLPSDVFVDSQAEEN